MNKLLLFTVFLVSFGAGCASSTMNTPSVSALPSTSTTVSTSTSALTDEQAILKKLSTNWQKDGNLGAYANIKAKDRLGACANIPTTIHAQNAALVPETYTSLLMVATHSCDAVLRVYLGCASAIVESSPAPDQWVEINGTSYACGEWKEKIILEDIATKKANVVADLGVEARSNAGGLFVPLAFTRDDKNIILDAWMGSPGAGGGTIDLGYAIIPRSTVNGTSKDKEPLAPRSALFYDSFGKMVYLDRSTKLPQYSQPGPTSNDGRIIRRDLVTLNTHPLLEEADTTYQLVDIDEKRSTLHIKATRHQFSTACPRAEDGLICSIKITRERTLPLQDSATVVRGCTPSRLRIVEPVAGSIVTFPLNVRVALDATEPCGWTTFEGIAGTVEARQASSVPQHGMLLGLTNLRATNPMMEKTGSEDYVGVIKLKAKPVNGRIEIILSEENPKGDNSGQILSYFVYGATEIDE